MQQDKELATQMRALREAVRTLDKSVKLLTQALALNTQAMVEPEGMDQEDETDNPMPSLMNPSRYDS